MAFNILTLVNHANVKHAVKLYRFLKDSGFYYHQYIPCVEYDEDGRQLPFAVSGEEWGVFLCNLFDEWYRHDIEFKPQHQQNSANPKKTSIGRNSRCPSGSGKKYKRCCGR